MTGRESLQGLVLPGQWPLRAPQAALPEHPLLSPARAGAGGRGCPPRSAPCSPQCVCPCSDPLWAGTGAGASQVLPTEPNCCQGAPGALSELGAAAPAAGEGACPAVGSPSWQCHRCCALGSTGPAKPRAALGRGRTLNPRAQALTALAPCSRCCAVGSAAACPLLRGPGSALVPFLLHEGPCIHPSSAPHAAPSLLP